MGHNVRDPCCRGKDSQFSTAFNDAKRRDVVMNVAFTRHVD